MPSLSRTIVVLLGLLLGMTQRSGRAADDKTPTFQGIAANAWVERLKDKYVAVRRTALAALAQGEGKKGGPSAEAAEVLLPVLFDTLKDTDPGIRRQAALVWVRFNG